MVKKPKQTPKPKRWIYAVLLLVVVVGCVIAVNFVNSKLQEQKTLADLEAVSKDLRVIYDKLLKANEGNVASSYYRNECSESSVKYGRGTISCGPTAIVYLNNPVNYEEARQQIRSVLSGSDEVRGVRLSFDTANKVSTDDSYAKFTVVGQDCLLNHASDTTYYLTCKLTVPDFLPSYIVNK